MQSLDGFGKHVCPGFPQPPRHPPPQHPPPPQEDSPMHGGRHLIIDFLQTGRSLDDEQQLRLSAHGVVAQVAQDVTMRHGSGSPKNIKILKFHLIIFLLCARIIFKL